MLEVYPIGRAQVPAAFDKEVLDRAIETLVLLPDDLAQVIGGCRDLDHPVREGIWSIRELVHHVADSHMNAFVRTKLALTEVDPTVRSYDEVAWSRFADSRTDPGVSIDLVAALHARWADLLRDLTPAELERPWRAPGGEPRPLWRLPVVYAWHGRHHVAQIRRAREHFGV